MWVFTTRGFYSVVEKREDCEHGTLTVRARTKSDLAALHDLLPDAKPFRVRYSDYPWRIRVGVADWAHAMARMTFEIDYTNFKDEVKYRQGAKRASVYLRVWFALLALEDRPRRRPAHASSGRMRYE